MSIYIHIPFCNVICTYCDFCKIYYNKKYISSYLDNLEKEIKERYKKEVVKTIYIGGGTPTSLSLEELERLLEITTIFDTYSDIEFTIECNVESITENKLKLMKRYGVNRISIGVQSFNDKIIELLGRSHTKEEVFNKINLVKRYFNNINIDLIYAVCDDMNILREDLKDVISLNVNHISTYSLIIEDHTILKVRGFENIEEDIDFEMYNYIERTLEENGYIHYEISNYAKRGYESRHNLTYWNNFEYYGFGLSSTSYISGVRRVNTKNLRKYLKGEYLDFQEREDKKRIMENEVMLGLRKLEGIDTLSFREKYGISLEEEFDIDTLIDDGYLEKDGNCIRISKKYMYVSNEIIVRMIN